MHMYIYVCMYINNYVCRNILNNNNIMTSATLVFVGKILWKIVPYSLIILVLVRKKEQKKRGKETSLEYLYEYNERSMKEQVKV